MNDEHLPPADDDGIIHEPVSIPPVVDEIPPETKKWVDDQIPKWKTGSGILCRAKNKNRKDIEHVQRYVDQLVEAGTIPASGKKTPASRNAKSKAQKPPIDVPPLTGDAVEVTDVLIADLCLEGQIRVGKLNELNIRGLMEIPDTFDPIDVFRRPEGELVIGDGHHRVEALRRLGRLTVQARIHTGTLCDAFVFAYKANGKHNISLTKEDRKNALVMIQSTPEGKNLTGDQLADRLGVSRQTIQTYLAEIRAGNPVRVKKPVIENVENQQRKVTSALGRIETRFGLESFRWFFDSLDGDKRSLLRTMLGVE